MKKLIEKLCACFQEQLLYYTTLEELIRREQGLIEGLDAAAVFEASAQKEALVLKIRTSEASRDQLVADLAEGIGCAKERVCVSLLLDHADEDHQKVLGQLRDQLKAVIGRVQEETARLERKVSGSMAMIQDTMTYIHRSLSGRERQGYSAGKTRAAASASQSVAVSTRA